MTSLQRLGTAALCGVALVATACGASQAANPTMGRPAGTTTLHQDVSAGALRFAIPSTWSVVHGTCRCGWGRPSTATLDNGTQAPMVFCSCPLERTDAPSALHLYEGQGGLVPGGSPTTIDGVRSLVRLDQSTATLTVTFPGVNQWIAISAAPRSGTATGTLRQVALEKLILASLRVTPGSAGTS